MKKYRYFIFIVGVLLTAVVCMDIYWWIANFDSSKPFEEVKEIYLSRFPRALRNAVLTTLIEIAILSLAAFCFLKTKNYKNLKILSWVLFGFDALIICWLLFTLM